MRALTTREFTAVAGGVSTGNCGGIGGVGVGGGGVQIVDGALGGAATAKFVIVNYVCDIAKAVDSTNVTSTFISTGVINGSAGANGAIG